MARQRLAECTEVPLAHTRALAQGRGLSFRRALVADGRRGRGRCTRVARPVRNEIGAPVVGSKGCESNSHGSSCRQRTMRASRAASRSRTRRTSRRRRGSSSSGARAPAAASIGRRAVY
eukprot:1604831-Prymnesium_polylepis.1